MQHLAVFVHHTIDELKNTSIIIIIIIAMMIIADNVTASTNTRKRRSRIKDTEEAVSAINRIADAMCKEEPNIVLPAPPQPDEVDSMLHAAGLQLRRMSYKRRMQTLLDIMQMVHTRLMEEKNID